MAERRANAQRGTPVIGYFVRRVVSFVPVLVVVALLTFALVRLVPGGAV